MRTMGSLLENALHTNHLIIPASKHFAPPSVMKTSSISVANILLGLAILCLSSFSTTFSVVVADTIDNAIPRRVAATDNQDSPFLRGRLLKVYTTCVCCYNDCLNSRGDTSGSLSCDECCPGSKFDDPSQTSLTCQDQDLPVLVYFRKN